MFGGLGDYFSNLFYKQGQWIEPGSGQALPTREYNLLGGALAGIGDMFNPQGGGGFYDQLKGGQMGALGQMMQPQTNYGAMGAMPPVQVNGNIGGLLGALQKEEPYMPKGVEPELMNQARASQPNYMQRKKLSGLL